MRISFINSIFFLIWYHLCSHVSSSSRWSEIGKLCKHLIFIKIITIVPISKIQLNKFSWELENLPAEEEEAAETHKKFHRGGEWIHCDNAKSPHQPQLLQKNLCNFSQTTFYKAGPSLCQGLNLSPLLFSSSHSPVIMMAAFIAPETSILHNKAIDLLTIYKSLPFCNVALNKYRGPITTKRNLTDLLSLMSSVDLIFVQAVSRQFTQLKSFFFLTVCNF